MKVELLQAWPRRFQRRQVELPESACVADALRAAGWEHEPDVSGYAVFGVAAGLDTRLHDGDRVELLRPLQADPKEARRRRAQAR
jgi:putative ubiquitin-RnfH superfamily antitoxin RatB of RatAB toxin-antitoxin module